jgi:hypothetical protein
MVRKYDYLLSLFLCVSVPLWLIFKFSTHSER